MLFEEAYFKYLSYLKLKVKPQSYNKIKNRFKNNIMEYFKNKKISDINEENILLWQIEIEKKGFSYSYKKTLYFTLVGFYNFLIKFNYIDKNIVKNVGNFKNIYELKKDIDFFTYEDYKKFIDVIDNDLYKLLFEFLFFTGVRLGEALALKNSDVLDDKIIINKTISKECFNGNRIITNPKTKKSIRTIQIDNILKQKLEKHKKKNFSNESFLFGDTKPLSPSTIERYKNKYCKIANVKQIRIHDFRHSHATLLIYNNVPIQDISKRLGHANVSTTLDVYTHVIEDKEKRVINTLNKIRLSN